MPIIETTFSVKRGTDMKEKLHFQIKSPENMIRFLTTALFEKDERNYDKHSAAWYSILDTDEGEQLFLGFAKQILPQGGSIDVHHLEAIKALAIRYLETDVTALECQADYDKSRYPSWVYFKPYHRVYPVGFAKHEDKVKDLLVEYFNDIDTYDYDAFRRFLRENFEIKSENTDIDKIVNDAAFLRRCVILGD